MARTARQAIRGKKKAEPVELEPLRDRNRGQTWLKDNHEAVRDALYETYGNLTMTAQKLKVRRDTLAVLCHNNEYFKLMKEDAREAYDEAAVFAIKQAVLDGNTDMMKFYAKSQLGWREADKTNAVTPIQINLSWNDGSDANAEIVEHEPIQELEGE